MTLFHLQGGTGNQLFCLSAAIAYQNISGEELLFDEAYLSLGSNTHPGGLNDFEVFFGGQKYPLKHSNSAISKVNILLDRARYKFVNKIGSSFFSNRQHRSAVYGFDSEFQLDKRYNKIIGYFQTFYYVDLAEKSLGHIEIKVKNPSKWYLALREEIGGSVNSVSMHIRRGDYSQNTDGIGMLSIDYFLKCLQKLNLNQKIERVYVFSDSHVDLLELTTKFPRIEFINAEAPLDSSPIESIILMSLTNFRIISNSTFSWWAGYLSKSGPSNYAPKPWFKNKEIPDQLIPVDWIKMDSVWVENS